MAFRVVAWVPIRLLVSRGYFFELPAVRLWSGLCAEAMSCRN